jgi:hypothetical protein
MAGSAKAPNPKKQRSARRVRPVRAPVVSGNVAAQIRTVAEMVFDLDARMERARASQIANRHKPSDECPGAPAVAGAERLMTYSEYIADLRETKDALKRSYGAIWREVEAIAGQF